MRVLERLLESSSNYEAFRNVIGAGREMETLRDRTIKPYAGIRVLDFGCGNGRLVGYLPSAAYIGVDSNPSYIDAAAHRYRSDRAKFICGDLLQLGSFSIEPVDVVVCIGVLHHLGDGVAQQALASARQLLRPGGRLVTMDPCFEPTQRSFARVLMAIDRGRFVRHPSDYRRLVASAFSDIKQEIWHDVYRFPYTHCVMTARAC